MKMKTICFVLNSYNQGGVSRFVEDLALEVKKTFRANVEIVTRTVSPSKQLVEGIRVKELRSKSLAQFWSELQEIAKQCDIVNVHDPYSLPGLRGPYEVVLTYHGLIPLRYTKPTDFSGLFTGMLSLQLGKGNVDIAVGISEYICNERA